MKIIIEFSKTYSELFGEDSTVLNIQENYVSPRTALVHLMEKQPEFKSKLEKRLLLLDGIPHALCMINKKNIGKNHSLSDGDRMKLLLPAIGG